MSEQKGRASGRNVRTQEAFEAAAAVQATTFVRCVLDENVFACVGKRFQLDIPGSPRLGLSAYAAHLARWRAAGWPRGSL